MDIAYLCGKLTTYFKYSAELFDRSAKAYFVDHSVYACTGTYLGVHGAAPSPLQSMLLYNVCMFFVWKLEIVLSAYGVASGSN